MKKLILVLSLLIPSAFAQQCKSVDEIKALVKNPPKATGAEYEAIIENYSCCSFDEGRREDAKTIQIAMDCAAEEALEALKKEKVKLPTGEVPVDKLYKNPSPVVRAKAYSLSNLYGIGGNLAAEVALIKEAFAKETDDYALKMLVQWGTFNLSRKAPNEIGELLIKLANHPNKEVRVSVLDRLASEAFTTVPNAIETVIGFTKDKDFAKNACLALSRFKDEKVLDTISAITADKNKHNLHGSCLYSAAQLWITKPNSEKAYKLYMDYMKQSPRNDKIPNSLAISPLTHIKDIDSLAKNSYFKLDELISVLTEIIKDDKANTSTRSEAVSAIAAMTGKAGLEKLAPTVEALSDSKANSVKKTFDRVLKRAK